MPNLFRFGTVPLTVALLMQSLGTVPAHAGTGPSALPIRPEHETAGPPVHLGLHAFPSQMPETSLLTNRSRTSAAVAATSSAAPQFLTRPYTTWHTITSIFDHCNPDYTQDGKVCRFDGSVGLKSNGVDPSFSLGYAQTPGGTDYLYYDGHNGWDYALNYENVLASADGTVQLAGSDPFNPCFGQTITVDHGNGYTTRYAHLSAIYVSPGQAVSRGQVIAQSGNTGCSTGPHLHFGVYITSSWTAIDPWGWWGVAAADPWPSDPGDLWMTGTAQFPLPWAPTNVAAFAGNASATVTWTPPGFDGGTAITSYTVTASPGGATTTASGSAASAVVTGLTNGMSYSFAVTALNSVGGSASTTSNAVIPSSWIGLYRPLTPARILDSRTGTGGFSAPLGANQAIDVQITGRGGVPAGSVADVILNVTVTNARQASYLSVYPTASARPATSNLNFAAGQTVARLVEVGIGTGGRVTVYNAAGSTDVIFDVSGWFAAQGTATGTAGVFRPLAPARLLDTRASSGGALGPGQSLDLQVTGQGAVPASGVSGVVVNLTVTAPTASGWVSVYPSGAGLPLASNVDFPANQTVANRAVVGVGTGGRVTIYNAIGRADIIVDVSGWLADGSDASLTGGLYTGIDPARVLDTRAGAGPISSGQTLVSLTGVAEVPSMSSPTPPKAVVISLTATNTTAVGYLTVYQSGGARPSTSDVNIAPGVTVSNLVVAPLGADGKIAIFLPGGSTDLIVDVLGWYS